MTFKPTDFGPKQMQGSNENNCTDCDGEGCFFNPCNRETYQTCGTCNGSGMKAKEFTEAEKKEIEVKVKLIGDLIREALSKSLIGVTTSNEVRNQARHSIFNALESMGLTDDEDFDIIDDEEPAYRNYNIDFVNYNKALTQPIYTLGSWQPVGATSQISLFRGRYDINGTLYDFPNGKTFNVFPEDGSDQREIRDYKIVPEKK